MTRVLDLGPSLENLKAVRLYRTLRVLASAPAARVRIEGKTVLNFASNNYLGLAGDERVKRAAQEAVAQWGAGATASRLLGGTLEVHDRLEKALADLKGTESAAVFPSGYHVNTGLLPSLAKPEDTIFLDRYGHASLVDGAKLSGARLRVFRHNDPDDLERILKRYAGGGQRWIVTESVFSMDGDVAPLREIVSLARRYGAFTYVDEAHATGVWGPEGRGFVNALGLEKDIDVCMGTLSKAFGSLGGFVCGNRDLAKWVHNRCRSFLYSTALPPSCAGAALKAMEISRTEPERRERIFSLGNRLRRGLESFPARLRREGGKTAVSEAMFPFPPDQNQGPIVILVVGNESRVLAFSRRLWKYGIFAPAIRPPTVPKGTSRLRFSLTAEHTAEDVDRVVEALNAVEREPLTTP